MTPAWPWSSALLVHHEVHRLGLVDVVAAVLGHVVADPHGMRLALHALAL